MDFIRTKLMQLRAFIARYSNRRVGIALLIVVIFLGFGLVKAALSNGDTDEQDAVVREVQTAPAGSASQLDSVFESTGEVKSQTQGDLRAQRAGVITNVNYSVGQQVGAGAIIASIENASERASVAQAQAGVAQAQASLNKVSGGTREEQLAVLSATTNNAQQALKEAQASIKNTLLSAYATTDATFAGGIDTMFKDADGANPELTFTSTNASQAIAAEHARFVLQIVIDRHVTMSQRIRLADNILLRNEIDAVEVDMLKIKSALDNLITALDGAVASTSVSSATITAYQSTASAARSNVLTTLSALSAARSTLNNAENAVTIAQENESQGITGAQQEDIQVAQAQLDAARATLAQAVAQLEDTRVRAPVTGVITILTVEPGDFVTSFQDVGLVANDGALEVQTFVAPTALDRVAIGGQARIDKKHTGVITSIAPGIDPITRQVEVRVALVSDAVKLTHGSRVSVEFLNLVTEEVDELAALYVPISALKLIGDEAFVFTVSEESTLIAVPVELGGIVQSSIELIDGVKRSTEIVLDARGLNEGEEVIVNN